MRGMGGKLAHSLLQMENKKPRRLFWPDSAKSVENYCFRARVSLRCWESVFDETPQRVTRQHTSDYINIHSIRQHTSAYVSIRQHLCWRYYRRRGETKMLNTVSTLCHCFDSLLSRLRQCCDSVEHLSLSLSVRQCWDNVEHLSLSQRDSVETVLRQCWDSVEHLSLSLSTVSLFRQSPVSETVLSISVSLSFSLSLSLSHTHTLPLSLPPSPENPRGHGRFWWYSRTMSYIKIYDDAWFCTILASTVALTEIEELVFWHANLNLYKKQR